MPEFLIGFDGVDLLITVGIVAVVVVYGRDAYRTWKEGRDATEG